MRTGRPKKQVKVIANNEEIIFDSLKEFSAAIHKQSANIMTMINRGYLSISLVEYGIEKVIYEGNVINYIPKEYVVASKKLK